MAGLSPLENGAIALRVHVEEAVFWFDHGEPERARQMLARGLSQFARHDAADRAERRAPRVEAAQ